VTHILATHLWCSA